MAERHRSRHPPNHTPTMKRLCPPTHRASALTILTLTLFVLLSAGIRPTNAAAAPLTVTFSTNVISEAAGLNGLRATVRLQPPPTNALSLNVLVSDVTEITRPAVVMIPPGSNTVVIPFETVNDGDIDGPQ